MKKAYDVFSVLLAGCTAFLSFSCNQASGAVKDSEGPKEPTVRIVEVYRGTISRPIDVTAIIAAVDESTLAFSVAGVVTEMRVKDGSTLKRGAVIARLERNEQQAYTAQNKAILEKAELDLKRMQVLESSGAISAATAQDARTNAEIARQAFELSSYRAERAVLVAPSDGWVVKKTVSVGEVVVAGQPVVSWNSAVKGYVAKAIVTDKDVFEIEVGQSASVSVEAVEDFVIKGKVARIGKTASPNTGGFPIEIDLEQATQLRGGLIAKVKIERTSNPEGTIPVEALVDANGATASVFTLDAQGKRAKRIPIAIAFLSERGVSTRSGLATVSHVITEGVAELVDGDRVLVAH
jgi:RND family efflux transporter MFP subunit